MIDAEKLVFTQVAGSLRAAFTGINVYDRENRVPAGARCATLVEKDNATYQRSLDSTLTEHHATIMYEANAYCDISVDDAKAQCKAIMAVIDGQMLSMGFTRVGGGPIAMPNADDVSTYRMVARYRAVISEDLRIYKK